MISNVPGLSQRPRPGPEGSAPPKSAGLGPRPGKDLLQVWFLHLVMLVGYKRLCPSVSLSTQLKDELENSKKFLISELTGGLHPPQKTAFVTFRCSPFWKEKTDKPINLHNCEKCSYAQVKRRKPIKTQTS